MSDLYSAEITVKGVDGELRVSQGQVTVRNGRSTWSCSVGDILGYTAKKPGFGGGYLCIEARGGLPGATGLVNAIMHPQAIKLNTYGKWNNAQRLVALLDAHVPVDPQSEVEWPTVAAEGESHEPPPEDMAPREPTTGSQHHGEATGFAAFAAAPGALHGRPDDLTGEVDDHPFTSGDEKTCPFCAETIKAAAILCRYCNSDLRGGDNNAEPSAVAAVPRMELSPLVSQDASLMRFFAIELTSTREIPVGGPLAFFEVHGIITNLHEQPWSFHLTIHGRRQVGGLAHQVGMMGQTETPQLQPGQSAQWIAKVITAGAVPERLLYQVEVQEQPGSIPVNRLDTLEAPEQLGNMRDMMFMQVAAQIQAFDGPASEGSAVFQHRTE